MVLPVWMVVVTKGNFIHQLWSPRKEWAAICGVTQSRTWLKRLSSGSSRKESQQSSTAVQLSTISLQLPGQDFLLATPQTNKTTGAFLVVQWIRLCTSSAGVTCLIPGQGTKTPHAEQLGKKKQTKKQTSPHLRCVWKWKSLSRVQPFIVHGILQARILELGRLSLLQGVFPTQELKPGLLHCKWILLSAEPQRKPKNTGVGSLSLLQWIFLTQGSNWGLLHCRWILYQLSYEGSLYISHIFWHLGR